MTSSGIDLDHTRIWPKIQTLELTLEFILFHENLDILVQHNMLVLDVAKMTKKAKLTI